MDYPNSNKAKKVFLVLMVGSGGQAPQGLQGDAEGVGNEEKVKFEKRRERAKARAIVKKKNIKGRDWVLKKKEVCGLKSCPRHELTDGFIVSSCIDNGGKKTFPGTRSTPLGSGGFGSNLLGHTLMYPLICHCVPYS